MNYILKPSLEYMALAKVAATLWNLRDVRDFIKKFCIPLDKGDLRDKWSNIEATMLGKVSLLPMPEFLKEKMLIFVRAIGCQILNWIDYHCVMLFLNIDVPNEFCWTSQGEVNKKKAAQVLVKDEGIDITLRYKLACFYCLEGDICELWDKMPEGCRICFYNEEDPTSVNQQDLVVFWTYDMKGEVSKLERMIERRFSARLSPYQYACRCAAYRGNRAAVEYFLQKVASGERKELLIRTVESVVTDHPSGGFLKESYYDILCVLLSQMEEEKQVEVIKKAPLWVLECFLEWPRQIFFIETASRMWNFLSTTNYNHLFRIIIDKLRDGCKDFNYQILIQEMWLQSHLKYSVYRTSTFNYLLSTLFQIRDENNIKLILKDTNNTEKKRFIHSIKGENACGNLIDSEAWGLLNFFIQECLMSKEEVIKFKKNFSKRSHHIFSSDDSKSRKMKLDKFFLLLDDLMCGFGKRKSVEDDHCEAKRLCNDF